MPVTLMLLISSIAGIMSVSCQKEETITVDRTLLIGKWRITHQEDIAFEFNNPDITYGYIFEESDTLIYYSTDTGQPFIENARGTWELSDNRIDLHLDGDDKTEYFIVKEITETEMIVIYHSEGKYSTKYRLKKIE